MFLFPLTSIYSQDGTSIIYGNVKSSDSDVVGIHVLNMTRHKATITDSFGHFKLAVQVNDTLLFSAVQLKKKYLVISREMISSNRILIPLEELVNELDEVVVRPYNLTGDIEKDIEALNITPTVSASSLGLPNANVRVITQNERLLFEADHGKFVDLYGHYFGLGIVINVHKILNSVSGRTQKLKKQVIKDDENEINKEIRSFFKDSLYILDLKIPESKIDEFFYFCQVDSNFQNLAESKNPLEIWEFFKKKSDVYRKENHLN